MKTFKNFRKFEMFPYYDFKGIIRILEIFFILISKISNINSKKKVFLSTLEKTEEGHETELNILDSIFYFFSRFEKLLDFHEF